MLLHLPIKVMKKPGTWAQLFVCKLMVVVLVIFTQEHSSKPHWINQAGCQAVTSTIIVVAFTLARNWYMPKHRYSVNDRRNDFMSVTTKVTWIIRSSGNQTLIARVTIQCYTYGANWTVPSLQIAQNLSIYTWISIKSIFYLGVDFSNDFMYLKLLHSHACQIVLFIIKHIINKHYKIIHV
jgi:hypothetical protein